MEWNQIQKSSTLALQLSPDVPNIRRACLPHAAWLHANECVKMQIQARLYMRQSCVKIVPTTRGARRLERKKYKTLIQRSRVRRVEHLSLEHGQIGQMETEQLHREVLGRRQQRVRRLRRA